MDHRVGLRQKFGQTCSGRRYVISLAAGVDPRHVPPKALSIFTNIILHRRILLVNQKLLPKT